MDMAPGAIEPRLATNESGRSLLDLRSGHEPARLTREGLLGARPKRQSSRGGFYIQTWGCQMNVEDSEQMQLQLEALGFEPVSHPKDARIIILNTCSVRKKPEDKAFSMLGELVPLKEARPDTVIGVCGCMAQARGDEVIRRAPHVSFVLGTGDLGQLTSLVEEAMQGQRRMKFLRLPERKGAIVDDVPQRSVSKVTKLKSFVPIQYGCDKFCTFCIVPTTRGRERSRATADIAEEVRLLAERGTKEITLLGQTVNSYGKNMVEGRVKFSQLLTMLAETPGLERIRKMSPYPRDFTDDLIEVIRTCPKVMEHCHLPLQAGHDALLKRMHRVYTIAGFREIVDRLRAAVPHIGLTTDIIVGFPEETEEEFEGTMDVVRQVRFDGAYCFAYSPRPGTPAAAMKQVPAEVKRERLNRLLALVNEITVERNQEWVGRTVEVLIEGPSPKNKAMLQGYSREARMVHFPGSAERIGRLASVKVTGAHLYGLSGELA